MREFISVVADLAIIIGVIIAGVSAYIANKAITANKNISKKSKTADFLFSSRADEHYLKGLSALKERHASEFNFRCLVHEDKNDKRNDEQKKSDMDCYKKILYLLNFYERVAVSIKNNIYDEVMVKEVSYSTVLSTYAKAAHLIEAIRELEGKKTCYQEFEWLYNKWKLDPLKKLN